MKDEKTAFTGQQTGGVRLSLSSGFCAGGFRSGEVGEGQRRNWLLSWDRSHFPHLCRQ